MQQTMPMNQQNIQMNKATIQTTMMIKGRYALQQNRKKENWKQRTTTVICHLAHQYTIAINSLQNILKP